LLLAGRDGERQTKAPVGSKGGGRSHRVGSLPARKRRRRAGGGSIIRRKEKENGGREDRGGRGFYRRREEGKRVRLRSSASNRGNLPQTGRQCEQGGGGRPADRFLRGGRKGEERESIRERVNQRGGQGIHPNKGGRDRLPSSRPPKRRVAGNLCLVRVMSASLKRGGKGLSRRGGKKGEISA